MQTTTRSDDRVSRAPGRARHWLRAGAAIAVLMAGVGAAHAGDVRWSIGLHLPLPPLPPLPGVVIRSAPVYAPPRVVYAPPQPVYEVVEPGYRDGPGYGPSYGAYGRDERRPIGRPSYGPEVVVYGSDRHDHRRRYRDDRGYGPGPVYERPRVVVRPSPPPRRHWDRGWD